jgi:digeranylgeranylglycerophospholipid reductase
MKDHYDIAVIGAGPGGSMAAASAAKTGRSVCLFERNSKPGTPVRCGEGIGIRSLYLHSDGRPEWIQRDVKKAAMISPDNTKVTIADIDKSTILDRAIMDGDLARDAVAAGAELFTDTTVIKVSRDGKHRYICRFKGGSVSAKIVIIADGVESRIARGLGWNTRLEREDVESCAFTRVTSSVIDQDTCVFHVGSNVAPGGYAWIFPRGNSEANVGLGISGTYCRAGRPKEALLRFIEKELPGGKTGTIHCGGVPVKKYIRPLVKEGAMLVGDAARQVNCISGAGIAYALYAGTIAGKIAAEAITGDSVKYATLTAYERLWKKRYGRQQERSFALKEFVSKHTDDAFLNRIAHTLARKQPGKVKYITVFLKTFSRHPILLFKAFKLFR